MSYFRCDYEWPIEKPSRAIAYGASQTGRFLRHFVFANMNQDETQKQVVFDVIMPHIAGGQRGDFNHRFAQPGSMGVLSEGQKFPFSTISCDDKLSGERLSLVDKCMNKPKILSTNTSWEYWRGDAALIHTTPDGEQDLLPEEDERVYLFTGTHHINGVLPLTNQLALSGEEVAYPLNTISYTPLIRAVLINALRWVTEGEEPPDSCFPNLKDTSLVERSAVIYAFRDFENFERLPNPESLACLWYTDLGPDFNEGFFQYPAKQKSAYSSLVPAVGENLNEIAGIRLPELSIPIGIHTGWNPRITKHGAPDQTATFAGMSWFNSPTKLPNSESVCLSQVEEATTELINQRYVLSEDQQLVIDNAMQRYSIAMNQATAKDQKEPQE